MNFAKRIVLFFTVNILVIVTLSIVLNVLGVQPYLTANGIDYSSLMVFCFVWGMGGALISLAISRMVAKWMMGVKVIDPNNPGAYQQLYNSVSHLAKSAGLPKCPEVGVYNSPEINAFATGPTKSRSLVAFSSGLLDKMSMQEIEGVAAHEIAHIQNGDMVTMTLVQGVVNAFVMFFARALAFAVSQTVKDSLRPIVHIVAVIAFEIVFMLLGMLVVGWFSRHREFRADKGGATLAGKDRMTAALEALKRFYGEPEVEASRGAQALGVLKISGKSSGLLALMATHPPLEARIEALKMS